MADPRFNRKSISVTASLYHDATPPEKTNSAKISRKTPANARKNLGT